MSSRLGLVERLDWVFEICIHPQHSTHHVYEVRGIYCFQVARHSVIKSFRHSFRSVAWEGTDGIWPNVADALILKRSRLELLGVNFSLFIIELKSLMILDRHQNFVSAQYLQNESMDFDQMLHNALILTWSRLGLLRVSFHKFTQIHSYGIWLMSKFRLRSVFQVRINEVWTKFAYALILIRYRLGLLHVNFRKILIELLPVIYIRISFPINILSTNWWRLTKFCTSTDIDKF